VSRITQILQGLRCQVINSEAPVVPAAWAV
jgi:hypothetical protein